jgi:hypothetical protein
MKPSFFRMFLSGFAVAAVCLVAPAQAQIQHQIRSAKVTFEMQQTPEFNVNGPKAKRINPLEWLEIEVELDLETVHPSGYIDQLDAEFFIGVRDTNAGGKPTLLTGKITFTEIRAIEKKAWLSAYVSPASLAKTTGKNKPSKADLEAVAVRITGPGLRAPASESVGISLKRDGAQWFDSASLKRLDGLILAKTKTPFAPLWTDRYPLVKDER